MAALPGGDWPTLMTAKRRYAADTSVSVIKSREDIERLLVRHGASKFAYGWDDTSARIQFEALGRHIRFVVPLPDADSDEIVLTPAGYIRTDAQQTKAFDQATRARWRALVLVMKAKLEAVEAGIVTFEDEFMAHVVLPDGSTVGDFMAPQIEAAYQTGGMPALLPGGN